MANVDVSHLSGPRGVEGLVDGHYHLVEIAEIGIGIKGETGLRVDFGKRQIVYVAGVKDHKLVYSSISQADSEHPGRFIKGHLLPLEVLCSYTTLKKF